MRKAIFIAVLSVSILVSFLFWLFKSGKTLEISELIMIISLIIVCCFAMVLAFGRLKNVKQNLPPEDELSRSIKRRAAASAYYVSLYMWLAMMFLEEYSNLERRSFIGAGIMGMALIFALSWVYHNYIRRSHD